MIARLIKYSSGSPGYFDVTPYVMSCEKLHETIDLDNSDFKFPDLSLTVDSTGNFMILFNEFVSDNKDIYFEIYDDDTKKTEYFGKLKTKFVKENLSKKTATIESYHIISSLGSDHLTVKSPIYIDFESIPGIIESIFNEQRAPVQISVQSKLVTNSIYPNQIIEYDIDLIKSGSSLLYFTDFHVSYDYFDKSLERLSFLGDFMRSFGCVPVWIDNKLTITGRNKILDADPENIQDSDILEIKESFGWEKSSNNIVLSSYDYATGNQAQYTGSVVISREGRSFPVNLTYSVRVPERSKHNTKTIECNIIANSYLKSGMKYISGSDALQNSVVATYLRWYERSASSVNAVFTGLDYFPGKTITINSLPGKWIIEDTWKDFAVKTTECKMFNLE